MDLNLANKVIMISGASEGLGFGIAEQLMKEGARVSIASRNSEKIENAKKKLQHYNAEQIIASTMDVTDLNSIKAWKHSTEEKWGSIYGLVINAGGPKAGRFDDLTEEDWQRGYELTLLSAVRLIHCVLPTLKREQLGSILAITSSAIKEPIDDLLLSNVYRSGVHALLKTLSRQVAKDNIRVNNLVPGRIGTERLVHLFEHMAQVNQRTVEAEEETALQNIPLQRFGQVDEFARAAAFLLSPAASYITGEALVVDGGLIKTLA